MHPLRIIFILALATSFNSYVYAATDRKTETVTCKGVDKQAKVGVYEGVIVAVTIEEKQKECRFSINGADVGSPPLNNIISGLNTLIRGSVIQDIQSGNFTGLAYALLAASTDSEIQQDLTLALRNERSLLLDCLGGLSQRGSGFPNVPALKNGARVVCGVVRLSSRPPVGEVLVRAGGGSPIGVSPINSVLVIGVARSDKTHYIVFPLSRPTASEIQIR